MSQSVNVVLKDSVTGEPVEQNATEGAARVISTSIPAGTLYTQTLPTVVAVRQRMTFDPPIKGVLIDVRGGAGTTDVDEELLVCFDAPSTAVADAWLTETNIAPRSVIKPNIGPRGFYFNGNTITYIDMISVGTTPDLDVTAEGIV